MSHLPSLPKGTFFDLLLQYPEMSDPVHAFLETLMRGPSPFSVAEREMLASYASGLNGCWFSESVHNTIAEQMGSPGGMVPRLLGDIDLATAPANMKPVLQYVRKLTIKPSSIAQGDIDAILALGWDEAAVVHANLICGVMGLINRWVEGLGIKADPVYVGNTVKQIMQGSYAGVTDMVDAILADEMEPAIYRKGVA